MPSETPPGMVDVFDGEFNDERVELDGKNFERCLFTNCVLVFSGTAPVGLKTITCIECRWAFEGAASRTVFFMKALYEAGGDTRTMIEDTLGI